MGLEKLSPSMAEQKTYLSDFHLSGNFSDCRSASIMMLQKDQGIHFFPKDSVWSDFMLQVGILYIACRIKGWRSFLHEFRGMFLYPLLCRINIHTKAPGSLGWALQHFFLT